MGDDALRTFAAIDIGTNSVLMLVARALGPASFAVVEERMAITRLGRGVDAAGHLQRDAIETTLEAVDEFARRARKLGAHVRAVGTSALRDARNRDAFLVPAARLLGSNVELVSGLREAELTYAGALHGLNVADVTLVDIGGGSTELARRTIAGLSVESLDVGAVRLCERYALTAPTTPEQLMRLREDASRALAGSRVAPTAPLVATAGTATTLAAIALDIEPYDGSRVHGARLTRTQIGALLDRIAAMSTAERKALRGLAGGREDVIVAGAAILACVCDAARAAEVTVSDGGLRVGLLLEMLAEQPIDPAAPAA